MKNQVWVVVASSSTAKIYHALNAKTLEEYKSFDHVESHLANHELIDDKDGRGKVTWGTSIHGIQERISPKVKESERFARQIADFLEEACLNKKCNALYLIALPAFLGHLRQYLGIHASQVIKEELHKDLTLLKPHEIREYLPPFL